MSILHQTPKPLHFTPNFSASHMKHEVKIFFVSDGISLADGMDYV